ncbi:MAG: DMT family transporter [Halopseudomonas sp.]
MSVPSAYMTVIFIWSTTPLAIVWSSESVSPVMAAMSRMLIAALVGHLLLKLLRIPLPLHRTALRGYLYATIGVYGAMFSTYLAASHLPSGLISLIFGLSPMVAGLLSQLWLREQGFTPLRWFALLVSIAGLGLVMSDALVIPSGAYPSVLLMLLAVLLFCISGVLVKGVTRDTHPLAQTVGALWCSFPLYLLSWLLIDGQLPTLEGSTRSLWAIGYLALFGSLLGFVSYFFILKRMSASTVALITLITPVIALALGNLLNDEPLTLRLIQGSGLICIGLAIYNWGDRFRQRSSKTPVNKAT